MPVVTDPKSPGHVAKLAVFDLRPGSVMGSSAIPQIGQEPGSVRIICGCLARSSRCYRRLVVDLLGTEVASRHGDQASWPLALQK